MSLLKSLSDADEIAHYEEALARYLDLELDAERFTALRLQQGVYGQRQEGVNMVRIKLPGGRLSPSRLTAIAEVAEKHVPQQVAHMALLTKGTVREARGLTSSTYTCPSDSPEQC